MRKRHEPGGRWPIIVCGNRADNPWLDLRLVMLCQSIFAKNLVKDARPADPAHFFDGRMKKLTPAQMKSAGFADVRLSAH